MPIKTINPSSVHAPSGVYSHAIAIPAHGRSLHIAGQVGIDVNGSLAAGFAAQAEQCWRNLVAVLEADGMSVDNLVKVTTYLTDMSDLAQLGPIRERFLGAARPASTLVGAAALARPEWLIEIDAVAFAADRNDVL